MAMVAFMVCLSLMASSVLAVDTVNLTEDLSDLTDTILALVIAIVPIIIVLSIIGYVLVKAKMGLK